MPKKQRPNPSFCVITLSDDSNRQKVNDHILGHLPDAAGKVLSPLGENRFVMARPVMKRLLLGREQKALILLLKTIDGVRDAAFERGEDVRKQYRERTPVAAPATEAQGAGGPVVPKAQWHLREVKAPHAWKMFPGGLAAAPWKTVRVGHIDTGYTEHPALGFADGQPSGFVHAHEGINYLGQCHPTQRPSQR